MRSHFQLLKPYENLLFTEFDYDSIMIYGSMAFSRDGKLLTMKPLKEDVFIQDPYLKFLLTEKDVTSIRKLYSCF
ncbi:astacin-like metalloprotease [Dinothrombium tinctorium]|uniref:Astacin-like metalloprotease n=1 Tax=Dinothrombium tinctorium TaxID=1965070 RepID=A0A443Q9Q0_9ACAR|nr:astacin-like metalloprotease [Dinothrombium tinctorium]RWR99526.1 astacin-like metalloprotease [Dinothrombium tinctorium]RWR99708.1 astacin-like metalloprotease [Dinothrombium tinctorium]